MLRFLGCADIHVCQMWVVAYYVRSMVTLCGIYGYRGMILDWLLEEINILFSNDSGSLFQTILSLRQVGIWLSSMSSGGPFKATIVWNTKTFADDFFG